jgi:hypothetical protein
MCKLCYAPLPVTTKNTRDDDDQMILQPLMSNQAEDGVGVSGGNGRSFGELSEDFQA